MTLNKLIIGGLFILSFAGCGENFQAQYSGNATINSIPPCDKTADGAYNIRVNAQISGDVNLTVLELVNANSNTTTVINEFFTTDLKINAPFVGGNNQFNQVNLRIYQNSEVDSASVSGRIDADRQNLTGLKIVRKIENRNGSVCTMELVAPTLTRE